MEDNENIARIKIVHQALEELSDKMVFVGGATVSLYTDRPSSEIRPTDDVDIVVELATLKEYAKLEDMLRKKGFVNDIHSPIICRYIIKDIPVDVMPVKEDILGFKNEWYPEGCKHAIDFRLDEQITIRLFSLPYFLASKLDAFNDRGSDGRFSKDLEDIVHVLNNRTTVWDDMENCAADVMEYMKEKFGLLLKNPSIEEWISCHLEHSQRGRLKYIIEGLMNFCRL